MLLAFDIGNSNMVIGVYKDKELITYWRIATDKQKTADEYAMLVQNLFFYHKVNPQDVTDIIFSSVVPPIIGALEEMARKYFNIKPLIVGPGIKTGVAILYENPREVGADRIVNAVAGFEKYGGPLIIVDFGTATTFCCISAKGEYLGGSITPGINIATEALFQKTAKLPKVELITPKKVIAKNTVNAIQSGIIYGYCGLVDGIVKRMKRELGFGDIKVIATGGIAELIAKDTETIDKVDKLLTLEGLRIIYERNR
ncbi:MAG: type pantothenate kinase [Clostridia bacterium]|jgi:type III pantothenate kinase|nr:type pantothenate kinase [Clostridia bacterium]MDN5321673.1 type pantothenate kinase [Clostridia bacterium]